MKKCPASNKYPTSFVEKHIYQKEMTFARKYLGLDNYNALLSDLVDYGKLNEYNPNLTYQSGEYVIYFGTVIQSQIDNNVVNPCEDNDTAWKEAKKFNSDCFNNFWDCVLWEYLAFLVYGESLDYSTYQVGAKGMTEFHDDETGIKTVNKQMFLNGKGKVMNDTQERLDNLIFYAKNSSCINLPIECKEVQKQERRKSRRIAF